MFLRYVIVFAVIAAVGCTPRSAVNEGRYFSTANGVVELKFPAGWQENKEKHPYDLQCESRDQRMNTGVFVYPRSDFAKDLDRPKVLEQQIDDLRSKRQNFQLLEQLLTEEVGDKVITSVVYSGERDSFKYNYRFSLIEFKGRNDYILVLIQVGQPSEWSNQNPILEEIARSARVKA